jgi:thermitase
VPAAFLRSLVALVAGLAVVAALGVVHERREGQPRASAYVVLQPHTPVRLVAPRGRAKAVRRLARRSSPAPAGAALVAPDDPLWRASWALSRVGAPAAWALTTGAPEIVVAVVDSGIDAGHPDLAGALVPGWDAVDEDDDAHDELGHGTAVAGVIAARSDNGLGVTGACWRCSLMPVRVIDAEGVGTAADIAEGIRWAADHGADVVNLSFVLSGPDAGVAAAIDHARARGALVVAAAGNTGTAGPTFPASHPGVVAVTAADEHDRRYPWATYGAWTSVAAPGCSQTIYPGGKYGEFCGTSAAAALLSGVVALVRSAAPGAGAEVVFSALASNAVAVGEWVAAGRVDVGTAVRRSWRGVR